MCATTAVGGQILVDDVNIGYQGYNPAIVHSVNDVGLARFAAPLFIAAFAPNFLFVAVKNLSTLASVD